MLGTAAAPLLAITKLPMDSFAFPALLIRHHFALKEKEMEGHFPDLKVNHHCEKMYEAPNGFVGLEAMQVLSETRKV